MGAKEEKSGAARKRFCRKGTHQALYGHEPAKISNSRLEASFFDFEINGRDNEKKFIRSSLGHWLYEQRPRDELKHHNELSPQDYLRSAIADVLGCTGIRGDVIKETTLFSLRPDLLVVVY